MNIQPTTSRDTQTILYTFYLTSFFTRTIPSVYETSELAGSVNFRWQSWHRHVLRDYTFSDFEKADIGSLALSLKVLVRWYIGEELNL